MGSDLEDLSYDVEQQSTEGKDDQTVFSDSHEKDLIRRVNVLDVLDPSVGTNHDQVSLNFAWVGEETFMQLGEYDGVKRLSQESFCIVLRQVKGCPQLQCFLTLVLYLL